MLVEKFVSFSFAIAFPYEIKFGVFCTLAFTMWVDVWLAFAFRSFSTFVLRWEQTMFNVQWAHKNQHRKSKFIIFENSFPLFLFGYSTLPCFKFGIAKQIKEISGMRQVEATHKHNVQTYIFNYWTYPAFISWCVR